MKSEGAATTSKQNPPTIEELRKRLLDDEVRTMIEMRAYEIFEARGGEHGHNETDWFTAEFEILTFLYEEEQRMLPLVAATDTRVPQEPITAPLRPEEPLVGDGIGPRGFDPVPESSVIETKKAASKGRKNAKASTSKLSDDAPEKKSTRSRKKSVSED